jgi:hypothetical protein
VKHGLRSGKERFTGISPGESPPLDHIPELDFTLATMLLSTSIALTEGLLAFALLIFCSSVPCGSR